MKDHLSHSKSLDGEADPVPLLIGYLVTIGYEGIKFLCLVAKLDSREFEAGRLLDLCRLLLRSNS